MSFWDGFEKRAIAIRVKAPSRPGDVTQKPQEPGTERTPKTKKKPAVALPAQEPDLDPAYDRKARSTPKKTGRGKIIDKKV